MVIPKLGLVIEPLNDYEAINLCFGRGAHETITFMMVDGEEVVEYSGYCWKKK